VKHRFLLDSNILYFAVKGVDEKENTDPTSAELVRLIGDNCHTVVTDKTLLGRYQYHIAQLFAQPRYQPQAAAFLVQILYNSAKLVIEISEPPELPVGVRVPPEDEHIVKAALISYPLIVTSDEDLAKAIKRHQNVLDLSVLSPREALELAKDS
jgi:hypothetical protein